MENMEKSVSGTKADKNVKSIAKGKHIGECGHCGFSLLADSDECCPRCETVINGKED